MPRKIDELQHPSLGNAGTTFITDADSVDAAIAKMGEDFDLIGVDALGEIDETTDLPPGVSQVKQIMWQGAMTPVVYWQLARNGYDANPRKPFCRPIVRSNPHFKHLSDTQFNAANQLTNGDLIVCVTSEKMALAYHIKKRATVDRRNEFMYEPGIKKRESEMAEGQAIRAEFQQGVTVGEDRKAAALRAMGA